MCVIVLNLVGRGRYLHHRVREPWGRTAIETIIRAEACKKLYPLKKWVQNMFAANPRLEISRHFQARLEICTFWEGHALNDLLENLFARNAETAFIQSQWFMMNLSTLSAKMVLAIYWQTFARFIRVYLKYRVFCFCHVSGIMGESCFLTTLASVVK